MNDLELRQQLTRMLTLKQAHLTFEEAVANFPANHINSKPTNCTYSFWQVLEHLRICQQDILDYIVSDAYVWPEFPDDLWPAADAKTDAAGWQNSIQQFLAGRQALVAILNDSRRDLFAPLANSGKQQHSILREINIIASHNSYHLGALVMMRQNMGLWP